MWDFDAVELVTWKTEDDGFAQDRAIEASGLTASENFLYVVSEKYASLLQIDPSSGYKMVAVPLLVPEGAELEGVTWTDGQLYVCDEANAAVYSIPIADESALCDRDPSSPLPVTKLEFVDFEIPAGKTGLEGIAVDSRNNRLYLLFERAEIDGGCEARIYPLQINSLGTGGQNPSLAGDLIIVPLEDCNWRLAGLTLDHNRLVGIKSQYPGEQYQLVGIDPVSGTTTLIEDITDFGRSLRPKGYGNNLEGITIGFGDQLFLVVDNADTWARRGEMPPAAEDETAFISIPPSHE